VPNLSLLIVSGRRLAQDGGVHGAKTMIRIPHVAAGILLILSATPVLAVDGLDLLQKSQKSRLLAPPPEPKVVERAPFTAATNAVDPMPELLYNAEQDQRDYRGECRSNGNSLCYDKYSNTVVYRPVRQYMPVIPGLTPENISLKRSGVVFKYSF
jgi:hypothetical protein